MTRTQFAIYVRSEQRGFYIGLGQELASLSHRVIYVIDNEVTRQIIESLNLTKPYEIKRLREFREKPIPRHNLIEQVRKCEVSYNVRFAEIIGEDRALGRGYLLNIENYPSVGRASWSGKEKLEHLLSEFEEQEQLLSGVDIVISQYPEPVSMVICDRLHLMHFHLSQSKYGNRYFWSTDGFQTSKEFSRKVLSYIASSQDLTTVPVTSYQIDGVGNKINQSAIYSYNDALKKAGWIIFRDTLNWLRRKRKKNTYRIYGWVVPALNKVRHYRLVANMSVTPEQVKEYKLFYFPLHMEPEVSLLRLSPEFTNTMEALVWVSKALPADCLVIVKEQANSFAVRNSSFYRRISQIHNVRWANPEVPSWTWIRSSTAVIAFTGTVGPEAVHFEKYVISYGRHQIINSLPTVTSATNYEETKAAIANILQEPVGSGKLALSRWALYSAQIDVSFELEEFAFGRKRNDIPEDVCKIGAKELIRVIEQDRSD